MIGNKQKQGQGIGTFALGAIIDHAFNNLNLRRLQLEVLESNTRAQALYTHFGFVQEGRKRKAVYKSGVYKDELLMGLLREEYIRKDNNHNMA